MSKQDMAFCIFYTWICVVGFGIALSYWYNEIFKKK